MASDTGSHGPCHPERSEGSGGHTTAVLKGDGFTQATAIGVVASIIRLQLLPDCFRRAPFGRFITRTSFRMTGGCKVKEEREQLRRRSRPHCSLTPAAIAPVIQSAAKDLVAIPLQL